MATTNFKNWNPTQTNQETDAQYAADTLRQSGAISPSAFPSATANKLFYQVSTMCAALGQMLAAKGFTNADTDINALAAVLANIQTTADVRPALQRVAYAPTVNFDPFHYNGFYVLLTGNVTAISMPAGIVDGQVVTIAFAQDNTGGRTVVFPSNMPSSPATIDNTPNAVTVHQVVYDGLKNIWEAMGPGVSSLGAIYTKAGISVAGGSNFQGFVQMLSTLNVTGAVQVGSLTSPGGAVIGSTTAANNITAATVSVTNTIAANGNITSSAGSVNGINGIFSNFVQAVTANISGAVNAASAALTGALSAASAVISGGLSAAAGVFSGNVKAGSFTYTTAPGVGRLIAGDGTNFTPQGTVYTGFTSGIFSGAYCILPDGTKFLRASATLSATGNQFNTATLTYPAGCTFGANPTVMMSVVGRPDSGSNGLATAGPLSVSSTNVVAGLQGNVPTGGGGGNFTQSVVLHIFVTGN